MNNKWDVNTLNELIKRLSELKEKTYFTALLVINELMFEKVYDDETD